MLIKAGYDIRFETELPTPMMAMLSIHPSRNHDLLTPHRIVTTPEVAMYDYLDASRAWRAPRRSAARRVS